MATWDPVNLPDLHGRVYAVTGGTGGIGYFAAEQLATAGAEVVLASRSQTKLETVARTLRHHVPSAIVRTVTIDLTSLASSRSAGRELADLARLDGVFLNGGPMQFTSRGRTQDGLPLMMGAHTIANVALVSALLTGSTAEAAASDSSMRVVHASTGFVEQFKMDYADVRRVPCTGLGAYIKAKTLTEVFAYELDRRLRTAGLPVTSIVTKPGVGVDAKTPERAGVRDRSTRYQRNPFTPWAQGKDCAAWSGVRALTDPDAIGGQCYAPAQGARGLPVLVPPTPHTAAADPALAARIWRELEDLSGVRIPV